MIGLTTKKRLAAAVQAAETMGYDLGHTTGYGDGYSAGRDLGQIEGHDTAKNVGYNNGWTAGWLAMHTDTIAWLKDVARKYEKELREDETRWAQRITKGKLVAVNEIRVSLEADIADSQSRAG